MTDCLATPTPSHREALVVHCMNNERNLLFLSSCAARNKVGDPRGLSVDAEMSTRAPYIYNQVCSAFPCSCIAHCTAKDGKCNLTECTTKCRVPSVPGWLLGSLSSAHSLFTLKECNYRGNDIK